MLWVPVPDEGLQHLEAEFDKLGGVDNVQGLEVLLVAGGISHRIADQTHAPILNLRVHIETCPELTRGQSPRRRAAAT